MYPPVLEHLEHEGRSASSRARADQQQVPGSVCCVVLTTVVEDCRLWTLPGSREKKGMERSACWVLICFVLDKSLLAASMPNL